MWKINSNIFDIKYLSAFFPVEIVVNIYFFSSYIVENFMTVNHYPSISTGNIGGPVEKCCKAICSYQLSC